MLCKCYVHTLIIDLRYFNSVFTTTTCKTNVISHYVILGTVKH